MLSGSVITAVQVSNFRSLGKDVRLRMGAMTALVGPNGSGKSNIASVFPFVADALALGLEASIAKRHGIHAIRRWSRGRPNNMRIRLEVEEEAFTGCFDFTIAGDRSEDYRVKEEVATVVHRRSGQVHEYRLEGGLWQSGPKELRPKVTSRNLALTLVAGDERFAPLAGVLRNVCVYAIFPDTLREPQKPDTVRPMKEHGENWVTILQGMTQNGAEAELRAALAKLTGDIASFRVRQLGGFVGAEFQHVTGREDEDDRQKWFESSQESDGTLRVAGIITALLQHPPLTLLGIEEPELTVHVGAIPLLFDYLRQASRHTQVLFTTHSIDLLELLDIEDVRVVERREGVTTVGAVRHEQREMVKRQLLSVGDVIRMEGLQQELFDREVA